MVKKLSLATTRRWQQFRVHVPGKVQLSILLLFLVTGIALLLGGLAPNIDHYVVKAMLALALVVYAIFVWLEADEHLDHAELVLTFVAYVVFSLMVPYKVIDGNISLPLAGTMAHATTDWSALGLYLVIVGVVGIIFNLVFDLDTTKQNAVWHFKYFPVVWLWRGPVSKRAKEGWLAEKLAAQRQSDKQKKTRVSVAAKLHFNPRSMMAKLRRQEKPERKEASVPKPQPEKKPVKVEEPRPASHQQPTARQTTSVPASNGARSMLERMLAGEKPNMSDEETRRTANKAKIDVGQAIRRDQDTMSLVVGKEDLVQSASTQVDGRFNFRAIGELIDHVGSCPEETRREFMDLVYPTA